MSIFSRVKNAKKAADHHKKALVEIPAEVKTPSILYKHMPTHAAQDSLACAPTTWTIEETRQKIAAAHERKRNDRTGKAMQSHGSAESSSASKVHRTESDLSIDCVIATQGYNTSQPRSPYHYNGPIPSPIYSHINRFAESVPVNSVPTTRSPLSSIKTIEVDQTSEYTESSKTSTCSTASSQTLEIAPPIRTFNKRPAHNSNFNQKAQRHKDLNPTTPIAHTGSGKACISFTEEHTNRTADGRPSVYPTTPALPAITTKQPSKKRNWFGKIHHVVAH